MVGWGDDAQVLVDGPSNITGVARQVMPVSRIVLTPYKIDIPRSSSLATIAKAFNEAKISEKFAASSWGKKIAQRETRSNLSDFQRFQVMVLKKKVQ